MNSINSLTLLGHVVRDPIVKTTQKGTLYAYFTVATSKNLVNPQTGETRELTTYTSVTAWRKQAETVQNSLHKGTRVLIMAQVGDHSYDRGGQKIWKTDVTADFIAVDGGGDAVHTPPAGQHGNFTQFGSPAPKQQSLPGMDNQPPFPKGPDEEIPF